MAIGEDRSPGPELGDRAAIACYTARGDRARNPIKKNQLSTGCSCPTDR